MTRSSSFCPEGQALRAHCPRREGVQVSVKPLLRVLVGELDCRLGEIATDVEEPHIAELCLARALDALASLELSAQSCGLHQPIPDWNDLKLAPFKMSSSQVSAPVQVEPGLLVLIVVLRRVPVPIEVVTVSNGRSEAGGE